MDASSQQESETESRISRTCRLTWSRLSKEDQEAILLECYDIYRSQSSTMNWDAFHRYFAPAPNLRLGLFYDRNDRLLGFSNASVLSINSKGQICDVFSAGVYFRSGHRGGKLAARFGLTEALRRKLRSPFRKLAYMTMASSPAPYHLIATYAPCCWPKAEYDTPFDVEAMIQKVCVIRGLSVADEDPWLVRTFVKPDNPHRIRASSRLSGQSTVEYYQKRNPDWDHPDRATALLMWVPLDIPNIVGTLWRLCKSGG